MGRVTLPAGRFLLDLPEDARARFGRQGFHEAGAFIQSFPGGLEEAEERVVAHVKALGAPHEEGGTRLEWLAAGPRPHSWFLYYWKDTAFKGDKLEANGYYWLDGVVFMFRSRCGACARAMAEGAQRWGRAFRLLGRRAPREVPPGPCFCIRDGFFRGGPLPRAREHIELLVDFPSRPGVLVRLCTDTLGETASRCPGLLEREGSRGWLRARERAVGAMGGQELIKGAPRLEGGAKVFLWEAPGQPLDPLNPRIFLEMRRGGPGKGALGEGDALDLWEELLGSLRAYPQVQALQIRADRLPGKSGQGPWVSGA
jgi:hypothetical protein